MEYSLLVAVMITLCVLHAPEIVNAAKFGGSNTIYDGFSDALTIQTGSNSNDFRTATLGLLSIILTYMGLAAGAVLIIAGAILVLSIGNDELQQRVRNILLYSVIGFFVIILAQGIIRVLLSALASGSPGPI